MYPKTLGILVLPGFPLLDYNPSKSSLELPYTVTKKRAKLRKLNLGEHGGTPREFQSNSLILISGPLSSLRGHRQPEEVHSLFIATPSHPLRQRLFRKMLGQARVQRSALGVEETETSLERLQGLPVLASSSLLPSCDIHISSRELLSWRQTPRRPEEAVPPELR